MACLVLFVLIKALFGRNGQIAIFEFCMDFILLEARQIHIEFIMVTHITDIGLHEVLTMFSIKGAAVHKRIKAIHKIIKHIVIKNARQ